MADDLRQLHAALGLGPAMLVGHSFGGVSAVHAAALYPECIAGVILSDSFFPGLRHVEPKHAPKKAEPKEKETTWNADSPFMPVRTEKK